MKVQVQELRVGNILRWKIFNIAVVDAINYTCINFHFPNTENDFKNEFDSISGFSEEPLTEDYLDRFGFEKESTNSWLSPSVNGY